ncbi:tetratricopeptide repeat protein [Adhaeribacter sp. BT258]|uniref:Tetratricopeptide repeat protein n=1 Tax=Adhaeribacter terrigena TaxID=2793070 RepID=A0ABS1C0C0_9BACT|nr:tetratricopeptide repeat protein [Adhaeribacter terrigena]MBK0402853.1 tetratricopeptide repeat protein [Adhaeribacter terrigena]
MRLQICYGLLIMGLLGACSGKDKTQEKMVDLKSVSDKPDLKIARLTEAIEKEPKNAVLYAQRSRLYLDLKKNEEALKDAEKAISLDASNGEFFFLKAKAQRALNRLEAALSSAKAAETKNYRQAELYILMGEIFIIVKQYQQAIDYLNQALKLSSFNEFAYFYKGIVYAESGDTTRAISNFQTAIEQSPEFVEPYNELAKIHTAQRKFGEAHQYIQSGLRFDGSNAFLHYNEGVNLVRQNLADSAAASFKQALLADTAMYLANYNLGVIAYNKDKYADAAVYFEKGLHHADKLPNLNLLLADSYEKSGRREDALRQYNVVLQKQPENSFALKAVRRLTRQPKNAIDTTAKSNRSGQ